MTPLSITPTAGGEVHPSPFVGPIDHTTTVILDISTLDTEEVDANGYVKPGVIVQANGDIITGVSQIAYGAIVEAVKVAADNQAATLAAAQDIPVAVAVGCLINRDIIEDSLGRALSANELAAIDAAGSHVAITNT